jgi:hypothetical protein
MLTPIGERRDHASMRAHVNAVGDERYRASTTIMAAGSQTTVQVRRVFWS